MEIQLSGFVVNGEYFDNHHQAQNAAFINEQVRLGRTVIFPKPNELFLDIDTQEDFDLLPQRIDELERRMEFRCEITDVTPSSSGMPHCHVTVRATQEFEHIERAALQLALGSDRKREMHGIRRAMNDVEHPTLFVRGAKWSDKCTEFGNFPKGGGKVAEEKDSREEKDRVQPKGPFAR